MATADIFTRSSRRRRRRGILSALVVFGGVYLFISRQICLSAWLLDGIRVDRCPDGRVRQTLVVDAASLRRGAAGAVHVGAIGHYTRAGADADLAAPVGRLTAELTLVDGTQHTLPLPPVSPWNSEPDRRVATQVRLPEVPDGDYLLRARVETPIGEDTLDVPLPLYAPARVHILTDRPLYQPGSTVQFRAVLLRARDLVPLDGRPGRWRVSDPSGEVVLEEKATAGAFGVAASSFPLDDGAPTGTWRVELISGPSTGEARFEVEPFSLPRFRVEAAAAKPFFRAGDRPVLRGRVTYASGAPVAGAAVEVAWRAEGAWPLPRTWLQGELPVSATADASGGFELRLPVVPGDLRGRLTLAATLAARDAAGDRVEGQAAILLAEDAIAVEPVTELSDGLVGGFNNRLYLRVTTAAGRVLPATNLRVKRAWQPRDPGIEAVTDEDGVAALQIDPGPPVNVVVPPMPARAPARRPAVRRAWARDLVIGEDATLAEQRAMDGWLARLEPCARFVDGGDLGVVLALHVEAKGAISDVGADGRTVSKCAAVALRGQSLPGGRERILSVEFTFADVLPHLDVTFSASPEVPRAFEVALRERLLDARSCLGADVPSVALGSALLFAVRPRDAAPRLSFVPAPGGGDAAALRGLEGCIEAKLRGLRLPGARPRGGDGGGEGDGGGDGDGGGVVGVARLSVRAAQGGPSLRPQATTTLGYELLVEVGSGADAIGATKVLLRPGQVPPVRLRAQPVLAEAGGAVELAIVRGPGFRGQLPDALELQNERGTLKAPLDPKTRTARFEVPRDATGWLQASWAGAQAFVYVRPSAALSLAVQPEKGTYAPGETAILGVTARAGERPARAAVGLFGVDESLGQLVALPGPDAFASLRPKPAVSSPAFGILDADALAAGRIRGANAAAATILRVTSVPAPPELDAEVSTSVRPAFEPLSTLTDHFYEVLAELHRQVRGWEEKAPKGELMAPATMAKLWGEALAACTARKLPVTDAYGRPLRLWRLPADLLALTDPRNVVVDGTRLPEDTEDWAAWVAKERP